MTALLASLALAAVILMALRLGLAFARRYKERYTFYRAWADEFYSAADRLVDNPETPDEVLEFVGTMNDTINFPQAAMMFVHGMGKRRNAPPAPAPFSLRTMPPSVVADFAIAFEAWTNAMAYRGMIFGPIFKAHLNSPVVQNRAKAVAGKSVKYRAAHA